MPRENPMGTSPSSCGSTSVLLYLPIIRPSNDNPIISSYYIFLSSGPRMITYYVFLLYIPTIRPLDDRLHHRKLETQRRNLCGSHLRLYLCVIQGSGLET